MYNDSEGRMVSAGADTAADDIKEKAEEEDWTKVEWFVALVHAELNYFAQYLPGSNFVSAERHVL